MLLLLGFLLAPNLKVALMLPLLVVFLSPIVAFLAYIDVSFLHHTVLAKRSAAGLLVLVDAIAQECGQLTAARAKHYIGMLCHWPFH